MFIRLFFTTLILAIFLKAHNTEAYSAIEDARIISAFRQRFLRPTDHARLARELVHSVTWASVGSISTDPKVNDFPMVNIISISDSAEDEPSTGKIYFMLVDLDFTGKDWRKSNKVTFMISKEQGGNCSRIDVDPMEPVCPRVYISGKVNELKKGTKEYDFGWNAFISRHPATTNWVAEHDFYLCLLDIENIYIIDWYSGPKSIPVKDYYNVVLEEDNSIL